MYETETRTTRNSASDGQERLLRVLAPTENPGGNPVLGCTSFRAGIDGSQEGPADRGHESMKPRGGEKVPQVAENLWARPSRAPSTKGSDRASRRPPRWCSIIVRATWRSGEELTSQRWAFTGGTRSPP